MVTTTAAKARGEHPWAVDASWGTPYRELEAGLSYPAKDPKPSHTGAAESLSLGLRDDDPDAVVHAPVELLELLQLRRCLPRARLFSGNIDHTAKARRETKVWLATHQIPELHMLECVDGVLEVGAAVVMSSFLERATLLQDSSAVKMITAQLLASFTPQVCDS